MNDSIREPAGYDWAHYGRHRLRAPDAVIVELPVPVEASSQVWVATIWPDDRIPGGWARALWEPTGRGWRLPLQVAAGDVIEFGADTRTAQCGGSGSWTPTTPTGGRRSKAPTQPRATRGVTRSVCSRSNASNQPCEANPTRRHGIGSGPEDTPATTVAPDSPTDEPAVDRAAEPGVSIVQFTEVSPGVVHGFREFDRE